MKQQGQRRGRLRTRSAVFAGLGRVFIFTLSAALLSGCSVKERSDSESANTEAGSSVAGGSSLAGVIKVDGSSTVFPITQAAAEEFHNMHPDVRVEVGTSGTGGGFEKFARGETDISDASRPVKESEVKACEENGIEFIELRIAIDGLSVLVNPENDWCECLTVEQLRTIWKPDSEINKWNQINPDWPDEPIRLFGPDTDSGTFDYFTEEICGKTGASRSDYTPSTDDNQLVRGIAGEKGALGYFGYAYYADNKDSLRLVGIAPEGESDNCVVPTPETIESGAYTPLSRPLFLYVSKAALERPEVREFLTFCLTDGQDLVNEVGYVNLSESVLAETRKTLDDAIAEGGDEAGSEADPTE